MPLSRLLRRWLPTALAFALLILLLGPAPAVAQGAPSGFELALHGSTHVLSGEKAHFRGMAYQVQGLARLVPLSGARVRARYATDLAGSGTWQELRADRRGFFEVDVPMPERPEGTSRLEISIGDESAARVFPFPLSFESPWVLDLRTDRQLYEPGETVHAWARLRDRRSRRPLKGVVIRLGVPGAGIENKAITSAESGVVSMPFVIPKEATEGSYELIAGIGPVDMRQSFHIGTRSYERIFASVQVIPETAQPQQPIQVFVTVTSASGALLRNARVSVEIDKQQVSATTDRQGVARVEMRAPAYMSHATGSVPILAKVSHPAQGAANAWGTLLLAVPLTLEVEAVPANGALVPDLDGVLYVRLSEGSGKAAPVGTPIEVRGAAIKKGSQRGKTDVNGIVAIATRLARGSATSDGEQATTTVIVHVEGDAPRTAAISVAVARETEVVPLVDRRVVAPGDALTIRLARRASAAKLPVVVELLSETGLIESRVVDAGVRQLVIKAPMDRLGVISIRARALHQHGVEEGTGGVDALIVRPPMPSFPTLRADKEVYTVKSAARLTLQTSPGAPTSWAAVLVRDLAAHAGEHSFAFQFLHYAFEQAVLDPSTPAADTLLRTALADYMYQDPAPEPAPALLDALGEPMEEGYDLESSIDRDVLRDPFPLADELGRRGVGEVMNAVEAMLEGALAEGRLSEVAGKSGGGYQFHPGLLAELEDEPMTVGEGKLSLAMLEAADRSFSYDNVARRVARLRLIKLLVALAVYLDPGDEATPQQRAAAREPADRWLARMVERGLISAEELSDPWGGSFTLRPTARPQLAIAIEAANLELCSPGPDGKVGTSDDIVDPFARAVPAGTPYALASGEDRLMAALARLSPGDEVLRRLLEAYQRVTREVAEEIIGDAVGASMSEGFGISGSGVGGGGMGYGSGSGSGSLAGRSARAPSVRVGSASSRGGGIGGFARVVRERFPPTLFFAPALAVNPSGQTKIKLDLSDAVTTYLVEAVVWSQDGWTWSTSTKIRVDKEMVIDSPLPRFATVGDSISLPVRIGNRSPKDRKVGVAMFASDQPDKAMLERKDVLVPGGDTILVPIELKLSHAIDGEMTLGLQAAQGIALDAVRRPITVQKATRRVRESVDLLASAKAVLELRVPARASPREGAQVRVRVGASMFALPDGSAWSEWSSAWDGAAVIGAATMASLNGGSDLELARAIGATWGVSSVSDDHLADALRRLTAQLDALSRSDDPSEQLHKQVTILLCLAPATGRVRARSALSNDLQSILRLLRKSVQSSVAGISERPDLWALSAAALAYTSPAHAKLDRVQELVRRVRRYQLSVGDYTWVATREGGHATSALLALAELKLGETEAALALLRTLARLNFDGRIVGGWWQALAWVAARQASPGPPAQRMNIDIDGEKQSIALQGGSALVPAPLLSAPGRHTIKVDTVASTPVLYYVEARTEYGMPWDEVFERPGSLAISIVGETGARNERARLELVVRNRSPRSIAAIVEISVPAGAELDQEAKQLIRARTANQPDMSRGTLLLHLPSLPPGGKQRIPLPFLWSVGGSLQGLGVAAYPVDRPDDLSISAPRVLKISEARVAP